MVRKEINMKGAIVLYGQPRFFECNTSLLNLLIRPYKLDVFFHVWWDPNCKYECAPWSSTVDITHTNSLDVLVNAYNPVDYIYEKPRTFKHTQPLNSVLFTDNQSYTYFNSGNLLSQYYSTKQGNLLKEKHERENGFEYDYVIRARFDTYISRPIDIKSLDMQYLNIPDNCPNKSMYNDNFSISSSRIHSKLCSLYDCVETYIFSAERIVYQAETIFKTHLEKNGISVRTIPEIEQLFIRGPNFVRT